MLFLSTAVQAGQPDYVALAMVLALLAAAAAMAIRKRFFPKQALPREAAPATPAAPEAVSQKATAPGSAGHLKLHDVEPKTAAMLMCIVAEKTGKPLNELRFISIKEVK